MSKTWNTEQAIELCRELEVIAPKFGAHVALTGGALYKSGERKDVDILIYRIRQVEQIDIDGFMTAINESLSVEPDRDFGWCFKASVAGKKIDFFFPERGEGGDFYPEGE